MTTRCAVVGHPIEHSLSPVIHRTAFGLLGLQWSYEAFDLEPDSFDVFVASRDDTWRGLSITMPLKEPALRWGDPSGDVTLTGAANTLVWHDDGRRTLHNTDVNGLADALSAHGVHGVREAVLIGSGATTRSSLVALVRGGVRRVHVMGRTPQRVAETVAWASGIGLDASPLTWGEPLPDAAELLLSTVPSVGVDALLDAGLTLDGLRAVFDVIYDPWPTRLAAAASEAGIEVLSGLDLLVHQAVGQVRLFTGRDVAAPPLMDACLAELRARASGVGH